MTGFSGFGFCAGGSSPAPGGSGRVGAEQRVKNAEVTTASMASNTEVILHPRLLRQTAGLQSPGPVDAADINTGGRSGPPPVPLHTAGEFAHGQRRGRDDARKFSLTGDLIACRKAGGLVKGAKFGIPVMGGDQSAAAPQAGTEGLPGDTVSTRCSCAFSPRLGNR